MIVLITFSLMFFLSQSFLSCFSLHVQAFSCLLLISLCRSFHVFSSVLLFVLFSGLPNKNSPRNWSDSSILVLCKALAVFHSPFFPPRGSAVRSVRVLSSPHDIRHINPCFSAKSSLPGLGYFSRSQPHHRL